MPFLGILLLFNARHVDSIVFVWIFALFGSTKFSEWLTFWCSWKCSESLSYDFQQSETMVASGCMFSIKMGNKVSVDRSTIWKNVSFVSLSIPPNTQHPSTARPLFYLRFPNLLSSLLTTWPFPSNYYLSEMRIFVHKSRQKFFQSKIVLLVETILAAIIKLWEHSYIEQYIKHRMLSKVNFVFKKRALLKRFFCMHVCRTSNNKCLLFF